MEVKLFVSHRIDLISTIIKNDILIPVYCGAVYKDGIWQEGVIGDNTGDNISCRREAFCELTVQYWVWKNVKANYYGLCHYRRYFSWNDEEANRNEQNQIYLPFITPKLIKKFKMNDEIILKKLCVEYEAIFPKPACVKNITSMGTDGTRVLDLWHAQEGVLFDKTAINGLLECIRNIQPTFYGDAIDYLNSNEHRGYNCYVMNKKLFYDMCEFEFSVLFEMEKKFNYELLKKYPRTIGYMGEILFGVFQYRMVKNNRKIIYKNLIFFENSSRNLYSFIRYVLKVVVDKIFNKKIKRFIKSYIKKRRMIK